MVSLSGVCTGLHFELNERLQRWPMHIPFCTSGCRNIAQQFAPAEFFHARGCFTAGKSNTVLCLALAGHALNSSLNCPTSTSGASHGLRLTPVVLTRRRFLVEERGRREILLHDIGEFALL